jgi:reticulon-4-interacting protein 1, mitochondrial
VTAIAKASDLPACLEAGAAKAVERERNPFANVSGRFDATLNFATWDDEANLLSCLREGALGHATTVHPLIQNFDEGGWVAGALRTIQPRNGSLRFHVRSRIAHFVGHDARFPSAFASPAG